MRESVWSAAAIPATAGRRASSEWPQLRSAGRCTSRTGRLGSFQVLQLRFELLDLPVQRSSFSDLWAAYLDLEVFTFPYLRVCPSSLQCLWP